MLRQATRIAGIKASAGAAREGGDHGNVVSARDERVGNLSACLAGHDWLGRENSADDQDTH